MSSQLEVRFFSLMYHHSSDEYRVSLYGHHLNVYILLEFIIYTFYFKLDVTLD